MHRSRSRLTLFAACAFVGTLLLPPAGASAQEALPQPRLNSIFPLGGKAGTEVELTVAGDAIEGAQQLVASHPSISAAPLMTKPDRFFPEPRAAENKFLLKIGADVPPGVYELRVANRMGVTNARSFAVGDVPETLEAEPNEDAETAGELAVNSIVNGACDARGFDVYKFKATKGQRLILHCAAQRLDAKTDPVLTLRDVAGTVLGRAHDAVRLDPVLDFTAPADGDYFVAVNDFLYSGGEEYAYRLSVSTGPWIDFVDPPVASPGAASKHTLYGRNLPGSAPADELTGTDGRPLEKLVVSIQAPADPAAAPPAVDTLIRPAEAAVPSFTYRLQSPAGVSNAVRVVLYDAGGARPASATPAAPVTPGAPNAPAAPVIPGAPVTAGAPNAAATPAAPVTPADPVTPGAANAPALPFTPEREPNDSPGKAQALTLPAQILGRFARANDRDWYTFTAKKDEQLWIEVTSQRLGLPTDPSLLVQFAQLDDKGKPAVDEKGKPVIQDVAQGDDQPRPGIDPNNEMDPRRRIVSDDPALLFTAPQDGVYRLLVKDLYGSTQGHPSFVYLLTVRPARPDFSLVALLPRLNADQAAVYPGGAVLRKNGSIPVEVIAFRREGFDGAIRVSADDLPAGVTAPAAMIAPWSDTTTLTLSAAADAAPTLAAVNVVGQATINGAEVTRAARALEVVSKPAEGNNKPPTRVVGQLALAVRDDVPAAPASVVAGTPGTPIRMARGGKISVPVKVARAADFAGALTLTPVGLAPQMTAQPLAVEAGATDKTLDIELTAEAPSGPFTFVLQGDPVVKYTRSPEVAAQAEADKVRAAQVTAESQAALPVAQQAAQLALQNQQQAAALLATATQQRDAATTALQQATAAMQAADQQAAALKAAAEAATPQSTQAADAAVKAAADEAVKVKAATDALAVMEKARADAEAALATATAASEAAAQAAMKTQQELTEATQFQQLADQRAVAATQLAQPKDVKFPLSSPPVAIEIVPAPFTLTVPAVTVKAGVAEPVALPLTAAPEFGFADAITFELVPPEGVSGVIFGDNGNTLPPGAAQGNLMIRADAAAKPGDHAFQLRARYKFNNKDLFVELPLTVTVTPADPAPK